MHICRAEIFIPEECVASIIYSRKCARFTYAQQYTNGNFLDNIKRHNLFIPCNLHVEFIERRSLLFPSAITLAVIILLNDISEGSDNLAFSSAFP